jgi:hypothetical protein
MTSPGRLPRRLSQATPAAAEHKPSEHTENARDEDKRDANLHERRKWGSRTLHESRRQIRVKSQRLPHGRTESAACRGTRVLARTLGVEPIEHQHLFLRASRSPRTNTFEAIVRPNDRPAASRVTIDSPPWSHQISVPENLDEITRVDIRLGKLVLTLDCPNRHSPARSSQQG